MKVLHRNQKDGLFLMLKGHEQQSAGSFSILGMRHEKTSFVTMTMALPEEREATIEKARTNHIKGKKSVGQHDVFSCCPYQLLI